MITKKDILKMVAHVTKRGANKADRKLVYPEREWALGLVLLVIILIGGLVYNAQKFSYYTDIESHIPPSTVEVADYNYGTMQEVLKRYDEKTFKFQQLRNGSRPTETDPVTLDSSDKPATEEDVSNEHQDEVDDTTTNNEVITVE